MSVHQLGSASRRDEGPPAIVLTGLRGAGKTTIGRALARQLRRTFIDLDESTLARLNATSVARVWHERGEAAWRAAEVVSLQVALVLPGAVTALGGGTLMIPEAQNLIGARRVDRTIVVYLRCTAESLIHRLNLDPRDRPPLTGFPLEQEVPLIFAQRDPIYRRLADWTIDTDDLSPDEVVQRILKCCKVNG